jgi:hypothetical protein
MSACAGMTVWGCGLGCIGLRSLVAMPKAGDKSRFAGPKRLDCHASLREARNDCGMRGEARDDGVVGGQSL